MFCTECKINHRICGMQETTKSVCQVQINRRQPYSIAWGLSELDCTCGLPLLLPSNPLHKIVLARSNITCESLIELFYYRNGLGYANLYSYCCGEDKTRKFCRSSRLCSLSLSAVVCRDITLLHRGTMENFKSVSVHHEDSVSFMILHMF